MPRSFPSLLQLRLLAGQASSKLCTFNTPFGRYMFKRLSFGLSSSQDIFQKLMSEMLEAIEGIEVVVDDLLI